MKESLARVTLRRIQDIIAEAKGSPLSGDAEKRLASLLTGIDANGDPVEISTAESFSPREVTILLADLRGFSALSSDYPPAVVLEVLNRCFVTMSEIIVRYKGTIDKFMGDSVMAIFFGDPARPHEEVRHAISCAVDMQIAMDWLNRRSKEKGLPELYMGIGINTGKAMAGTLGSEVYSVYTVVGEDVNLASRIEAFSLRGQILISHNTYASSGEWATTGEPMEVHVKGRAGSVHVREVLGIPSTGQELPRQEARRSPRVKVTLPFSFQAVENKIVMPRRIEGTILDMSYHGVLVQVDEPLALHTDLKLKLDLPLVRYSTEDVYAKVVKLLKRDGQHLVGLEFTSDSGESESKIRLFVQLLIQGNDVD